MRISDWSSDVCSSDLFRFVTAQKVSRKNYDWVGLWVAEGNDQRTQSIGFNDPAHTVLANLPFRFGGMASLPHLHAGARHITLTGEGSPGQPVPLQIGRASGRERAC